MSAHAGVPPPNYTPLHDAMRLWRVAELASVEAIAAVRHSAKAKAEGSASANAGAVDRWHYRARLYDTYAHVAAPIGGITAALIVRAGHQALTDREWALRADPLRSAAATVILPPPLRYERTADDPHPHALALQMQFLRPATTGECELRVRVLRVSPATASVQVQLWQRKERKAIALVLFGTLPLPQSHQLTRSAVKPHAPPPADAPRATTTADGTFATATVDKRSGQPLLSVLHPSIRAPLIAAATLPLRKCTPLPPLLAVPKLAFWQAVCHRFARADADAIEAWVWPADGTGWDLPRLALTADLLPPHPMCILNGDKRTASDGYWFPTLTLDVVFHGLPPAHTDADADEPDARDARDAHEHAGPDAPHTHSHSHSQHDLAPADALSGGGSAAPRRARLFVSSHTAYARGSAFEMLTRTYDSAGHVLLSARQLATARNALVAKPTPDAAPSQPAPAATRSQTDRDAPSAAATSTADAAGGSQATAGHAGAAGDRLAKAPTKYSPAAPRSRF